MLPQLKDQPFLMDGGIETTLLFLENVELRDFAAFELFESADGRARLDAYYRSHAAIARTHGAGFIFEAPTWRASARWGDRLGYDAGALDRINRTAITMMQRLRDEFCRTTGLPGVVSGCVGSRDDGYDPDARMTITAAQTYHHPQLASFVAAGADMATALTMTYPEEAAGIARAARGTGVPLAVSFTVETDGRLPTGENLEDAIRRVDDETDAAPIYYMVNCAHPDHFRDVIAGQGGGLSRVRGVRANASKLSHAELDDAEELDDGDPVELGADYKALCRLLPSLSVFGGCCGTDTRHIAAIARNCVAV